MDSLVMTNCPNCQSSWGFEEMQWGQCDCCGYPNTEDEEVDDRNCINCGCAIQIAFEVEDLQERNAICAFSGENDQYIGGICWDCAEKLCNKGEICIGGGGHSTPEAFFMSCKAG